MLGQVAAFLLAATLVTIVPGPDMALVARRAVTDGWRRASITSAGVVSGLLVHATASAIGISAILVRSATSFRAARHVREQPIVDPKPPRSGRTAYAQGFLNNVLNPKPALFYLAFVPQFIEPGDPVFLMTGLLVSLHIAISIVWLVLWGWMIGRASGALTSPRWRANLERVTGCVLVGLGVRLATTSR
jgi:threonine/homoserine/homoserine lactone efflux protein